MTPLEVRSAAFEWPLDRLTARAREVRDAGFADTITYSPKVFIPLTRLCRDVCRYCTYATTPSDLPGPYLELDEVLRIAEAGARRGCREALFTLGDRPESRWPIARAWLDARGLESTLAYLEMAARAVLESTGLLPHVNAGVLTEAEYRRMRAYAPSMGLMLESASPRLCERGGPHHGCPDKLPAVRLESIAAAGRARVPLTSGLLIGIGETRAERFDSLLALHALQSEYGHLQELILQNFVPKADTAMHAAPPAAFEELVWTIAVARLLFGPAMNLQAPPNLNPSQLPALIDAGINDWGGVSPVTPDHVNPESPWPQIATLARHSSARGRALVARLTVYPGYVERYRDWIDPGLAPHVLRHADSLGFAREDTWCAGASPVPPPRSGFLFASECGRSDRVLTRAAAGAPLDEQALIDLFAARGAAAERVIEAADRLRAERCGDEVTFVVNCNINYTNICTHRCGFCAFSKGRAAEHLRGRGYLLRHEEVASRALAAWNRGATEVCMQGGIHPDFDGHTYLQLVRAVKEAAPGMHVHAFSPLEVHHGASTLGLPLHRYLEKLRDAGLGSLPGTAAEILDDPVRRVICPDKLDTARWLEVVGAAHEVGLRTTATIMFGHVEHPRSWVRHLIALRELQTRTGGFTEFVPLPFVHMESPLFRRGLARPGPTWREARLMHAIARLALHPGFAHVQASWVKLGPEGAAAMLDAGADDLGGVLMHESISRAAGAAHGQELDGAAMRRLIGMRGRRPVQRTTLYARLDDASQAASVPAAAEAAGSSPPGAVRFRG